MNGRVTGMATSLFILVTSSSASSPIPSSTPRPIPSPSPDLNRDSDGDGFKDSLEVYMGTNPNLACGINAWPPDFDNNGKVTGVDISAVVGHNGTSDTRYDLNGDGKVDTADIDIVKGLYGKSCTP